MKTIVQYHALSDGIFLEVVCEVIELDGAFYAVEKAHQGEVCAYIDYPGSSERVHFIVPCKPRFIKFVCRAYKTREGCKAIRREMKRSGDLDGYEAIVCITDPGNFM